VGWAAGIERLAMLVGAREEEPADLIIVVEDDARIAEAIGLIGDVRKHGFTAELIASGSPRKRYDKAVKRGAKALLSLKPEMGHAISGDNLDTAILGVLGAYR
jgi:histidyl-tRNA synthetase